MNTIVNTNVSAMNSHRAILSVGGRQARSAERLSSGMRINRAADDAAGLAVSEKMRNQIRGLDQATRNSQDGISLIQTAEGALEEIHRILERARELTNQASNDVYTQQDRRNIHLEVDQILQEIDQTANNTEFNTMNLLTGVQMTVPNAATLNTMRAETETAQNTLDISTASRVTAQEAHDAVLGTLAGAESRLEALLVEARRQSSGVDQIPGLQVGHISEDLRAALDAAVTDVANARTSVGNVTGTAMNNVTGASAVASVPAAAAATGGSVAFGATTTMDQLFAADTSTVGSGTMHSLAAATETENIHRILRDASRNAEAAFIQEVSTLDIQVQSGANSLQRTDVGIRNMTLDGLGLRYFTQDFADAIVEGSSITEGGVVLSRLMSDLDSAINTVSGQRAELGAIQNRLEHTINNLRVASENTSASNSRIRDTDMAREMMQFTQANVLQQAGMSMLAQANMAPQNILQLVG